MSEKFNTEDLSTSIISAAALLNPSAPETLSSKGLIPYFKEFGMTDDNVVPSGLREYTSRVLELVGLPATMEGLRQMLQLKEVQATLTSAIANANQKYQEKQARASDPNYGMPDMTNLEGITTEQMRYFTQKAAEEQEQLEKRRNYATDVFVNPFETKTEPPVEETPEPSQPEKSQEEPLEDKPEPLPEPAPATAEHTHTDPFCPRCGWVVSVPYKPEFVSEDDRIQFAYSIMHKMPFKKTYGLFQNQIKVTFRSKTVEDSELLLEQLRQDSLHGKFADLGHMNHFAVRYEMAMLLDKIEGPEGDFQFKLKPQFKSYANEEEPVLKYADAIYNEYIVSDVLKQLIEVHFRSFNRLYASLIDEAMKENFYSPA